MYEVKNCHPSFINHKYTVIRDCNDEAAPNNGYWYWCSYDKLELAYEAANDLPNGMLVESELIVAISYDRW